MLLRSAHATIKGYYYQFDTSILKVLELPNDNDYIAVEGIEDIDIKTATDLTTIQCKYLSKPSFIKSAIREPIILMLDHSLLSTTSSSLKYTLYAHFENEKPGTQKTIDLAQLKSILTYKEAGIAKCHYKDKSITDPKLTEFLDRFTFIFGDDFYEQQKKVINKLKKQFGCTDIEADTHFYNNALRIIIDKAIKPDENQRKIVKTDFLTAVDCRKQIFNDWYIKLRSKNAYINLIKTGLQQSKALLPSKSKYIIIGEELINYSSQELPLLSFIENLINKYYKMNSTFRNSKPITLILDCAGNDLMKIKKNLIERNISFNDGYESIHFSVSLFNSDPIINRNKNQTKIVKSSFLIKLISTDTLSNFKDTINEPHVVLNFSKKNCQYSKSDTYQLFDIKYCENIDDISKLLL